MHICNCNSRYTGKSIPHLVTSIKERSRLSTLVGHISVDAAVVYGHAKAINFKSAFYNNKLNPWVEHQGRI